ncbi:hypothetical protein H0H93_005279, partial [Arthromyces matolae]
LHADGPTKKVLNVNDALTHLANPGLKAVFVADASFAKNSNAKVLSKLVEFARGGGSVVMAGSFSSFITPPQFANFFSKAWGLNWKAGSYHRATFKLNQSHDLAKSSFALPVSYSMKALHVQGIPSSAIIYKEDGSSESPAVQVAFGKGRVGYIGDVNWESSSITVLRAMLSVPANSDADEDTEQKSEEKFVLFLSLEDELDDSYKQATVNLIKSKSTTRVATTKAEALRSLSSDQLRAAFVVDAAIMHRKNAPVLAKLVEFVKAGGSVVIGGAFSTFAKLGELGPFFVKSWGVPWKPGSYHRTTFSINSSHDLAKANPQLPQSYSMKALHLKDISPDVVVYKPTQNSRLESLVFAPDPITNMNESPASGAYHRTEFLRNAQHSIVVNNSSLASSYSMKALHLRGLAPSDPVYLPKDNLPSSLPFEDHMESPAVRRKIGEGYFGYVGDVNMETETTSLVLAMFGLLDGLKTVEEPSQHAKPATGKPSGKTPEVTSAPEDMTKPLPVAAGESQTGFRTLPVGPTRRPFIMILSFGGEKFFAGAQADLLELLKSKLEVLHGLSNERVLELLRSQDLTGVLVTDAAIIDEENAYLLSQLVEYAKAGGTVVMGSAFSSHIRFDELSAFFKDTWGVSWESGNYTRCDLVLNTAHHLAKTPGLPKVFTMKGLFVSGVASQSALYVPATDSHIPFHESSQAPVAMEQVGKGRVGYIGDVGLQDEHTKIVMAMFGLLSDSSS